MEIVLLNNLRIRPKHSTMMM